MSHSVPRRTVRPFDSRFSARTRSRRPRACSAVLPRATVADTDSPLVAEHAVFVHLEAATFGHRPQPNVVVFRTREVLQPGAPAVRVEDAQVDLDRPRRSLVVVILDADDDLRLARGEDFDDTGE